MSFAFFAFLTSSSNSSSVFVSTPVELSVIENTRCQFKIGIHNIYVIGIIKKNVVEIEIERNLWAKVELGISKANCGGFLFSSFFLFRFYSRRYLSIICQLFFLDT